MFEVFALGAIAAVSVSALVVQHVVRSGPIWVASSVSALFVAALMVLLTQAVGPQSVVAQLTGVCGLALLSYLWLHRLAGYADRMVGLSVVTSAAAAPDYVDS